MICWLCLGMLRGGSGSREIVVNDINDLREPIHLKPPISAQVFEDF